jgi:Phage integrase family
MACGIGGTVTEHLFSRASDDDLGRAQDAHEGRHTAVSIMSSNGVPLQEISDTVGHKSTHVTETVYRHVIVPAIRGGATVMDTVFGGDSATKKTKKTLRLRRSRLASLLIMKPEVRKAS